MTDRPLDSLAPDALPLGKDVAYDAPYDPKLLCPIPRQPGREALGLAFADGGLPFSGVDIWTAYELSWLDARGKPIVACAEIHVPAESVYIVESKSLKLYLNSFNQHHFTATDAVRDTIVRDLSGCLGTVPTVRVLLAPAWGALMCAEPAGTCIDALDVAIEHYQPAPELLRAHGDIVSETLYSHLLRSRCPVTGQPDWATLSVDYTGPRIEQAALLAYIVSFRLHQDFHEHCVERIFVDLQRHCAPQRLSVYARYLRRGGIDINPYRSTAAQPPPALRGYRQ